MNSDLSRLIRDFSFSSKGFKTYPQALVLFLVFLYGCGGSKPGGIGALEEYVFLGPVDGWSGAMEDGVYWLENEQGNSGDIRYFYTPYSPSSDGKRTASIEVNIANMHPEGKAGLLYGYRDSPRSYQLIVVSGEGSVEIYRRDESGFNQMLSSSINVGSDDFVRLEIAENGSQLKIKANGKSVSEIENDQIGQGMIGIAALGLGRFGFTNYEQVPSGRSSRVAEQTSSKQSTSGKKLKFLDFQDREMGMVQHRTPFPSGWKYDNNPNDQLLLVGPNGTEVYESNSGLMTYSNDPFARQSAQMAGAQVVPVMNLNQYLSQRFSPYMEQRGYRMTNQFPMPEARDLWEVFGAGMPQGLSRRQYDVIGVEWDNGNGSKAFTVLIQMVLTRQDFVTWNVSAGEMYASESEYESAKEAYAYASANIEVNPNWQIAKNNQLLAKIRADKQVWDERMRQSQIQHIGRMNSILARSETSSSVAKINSDILDISHAGYLKRSDMVSTGQANSVNMIGEQSVISNVNTGEMYKVDAGYNNYWVNGDGKYFHTDNSNYDPRMDNSINNQQWERFEVVR